jgi:hypothetical protein
MAFDRTRLRLLPLNKRVHDLDISIIKDLQVNFFSHTSFSKVAVNIKNAKKTGKSVIMMLGGHVIRSGVQRYIIDMMEKGYITCLAMNGSGVIHDFELALIGATTENVARYIREGQFGLWKETGQINDIVNEAYKKGKLGMGGAVGKAIYEGVFPNKDISLLAACYRLHVPATVHVSIGYDIIHEHPNFDGAAAGATSYIDFLKFAAIVSNLEDGVVMNFGSAVMAPEVFLKALSMAKNVAHREGKSIRHFTTLVCDLYNLPDDCSKEPSKDSEAYYFRPWKTMLARTVADGGEGFYIKGKHADTIPALWTALNKIV